MNSTPDSSVNAQPVTFPLGPMLRRQKWILVSGLVIGLTCGAAFVWFQGWDYESTAQMLVIQKRLDTTPITGPNPAQPQYEDYLSTHQVVIRSREFLDQAIKSNKLEQLETLQGKRDFPKALKERLSVNRVFNVQGGSQPNNILNLSVRAKNADDAKLVLQAVINEYVRFLDSTYRDFNAETMKLIGDAQSVLKNDFIAKQDDYVQFLKTAPAIGKSKDGKTVAHERIFTIDSKRAALQMRMAEIRVVLAAVAKAKQEGKSIAEQLDLAAGIPIGQSILSVGVLKPEPWQSPRSVKVSLEEELVHLQLEEERLLNQYGPNHDQVKSLRERRDSIHRLIRPEVKSSKTSDRYVKLVETKVRALSQELQTLTLADNALKKLYDEAKDDAKQATLTMALDEKHRKAIESSFLLYESIVKRLPELKTVKDFGGFKTEILAVPQEGRWLWRRPLLTLAIAGFFGLALGFAGGCWREWRDTSIHNAHELADVLGVNSVLHVPRIVESTPGDSEHHRMLICRHQPDSPTTEALRSVRSTLLRGRKDGQCAVWQTTSVTANSEQAAITANLACLLASAGNRVLLVDGNLRTPWLHDWFELENQVGLSSVLLGRSSPDDGVKKSSIGNLSLLPSGANSVDAAELLASPKLREVIETWRNRFDVVLFDLPPLTETSDVAATAHSADAAVLFVDSNNLDRPQLKSLHRRIDELNITVLSVIASGMPQESSRLFGGETPEYS